MCIQLTKPVVEGKIKGKYDILQWAKVDLWIASLDWAPVGASDQRMFTSSHQCSWHVIHGYNIYIYTWNNYEVQEITPHIYPHFRMHIYAYQHLWWESAAPSRFSKEFPIRAIHLAASRLSSLDVLPQGVIALRQGAGWHFPASWRLTGLELSGNLGKWETRNQQRSHNLCSIQTTHVWVHK